MNEIINLLIQEISEFSLPIAVFFVVLLVGVFARRILLNRLKRWSERTQTKIDDVIVAAIKGPLYIWCIMLGMYLALEVSNLSNSLVKVSSKTLLVLGIISVTLVVANIIVNFIKLYSSKLEGAFPAATFTQNVTRIIVFGVGALVVLNSLGISITPILATLGVGGLAVALALQETLSNLFAGFHVIASRQIRIGDYVKLDSGQEGYVIDINWRTTKIKMLPNNIVLVPNDKLIKSIVVNYYLPDKELAVPVEVGVHYDSDLNKVERITSEVGRQVMKEVSGAVTGFEPSVRFHSFGDSSINFTVVLRAKEFADQYLIKHEFIKKLHERYKKEDIVIPYPIRTINYEQEKVK